MSVKFFISSNAAALAAALSNSAKTATVEAEFGDVMVQGTLVSLGHHGPRSGQQCPCLAENFDLAVAANVEALGLSHVDLDSLGGCMAVCGCKPAAPEFWAAAAEVDVKGVHKVGNGIDVDADTLGKLQAFWAWSEANRLFPPRDGSVADCTEFMHSAQRALDAILGGDAAMLEAGAAWAAAKEKLAAESYHGHIGPVAVRCSESFVNHLYGRYAAVAGFNTKTKSVTISLADPIQGVSCKEIVQSLWGELAGGHAGIAGSPRGQEMILADAYKAAEALSAAIGK